MSFTTRPFLPSPDGSRFLTSDHVSNPEEEAPRSGIKVVQHWIREFED